MCYHDYSAKCMIISLSCLPPFTNAFKPLRLSLQEKSVNMKEFCVLSFHRCILNFALHFVVFRVIFCLDMICFFYLIVFC